MILMSVEGLDKAHVSITDNGGKVLYQPEEDNLAGVTTTQMEHRQQVQRNLERRIEEILQPMDQAGEELKEFRADVGQMLGNLLRAVEAQRGSLVEDWRAQLAELTRVAVEAGTGWVLEAEHRRILRNLVFTSLQLLEDRATVSIRVHPDDEDTVSDLFRAARERVPELSQWIVNGDPSVEAGGLVAESVSGSVENLREHYREMVNGILEHLTLPPRPEEERAGEEVSATAARESERLTQIVPEAAPVAEPEPELPVEPVDTMGQPELLPEHLPEHPAETLAEASPESGPESGQEFAPESAPDMPVDAISVSRAAPHTVTDRRPYKAKRPVLDDATAIRAAELALAVEEAAGRPEVLTWA